MVYLIVKFGPGHKVPTHHSSNLIHLKEHKCIRLYIVINRKSTDCITGNYSYETRKPEMLDAVNADDICVQEINYRHN